MEFKTITMTPIQKKDKNRHVCDKRFTLPLKPGADVTLSKNGISVALQIEQCGNLFCRNDLLTNAASCEREYKKLVGSH